VNDHIVILKQNDHLELGDNQIIILREKKVKLRSSNTEEASLRHHVANFVMNFNEFPTSGSALRALICMVVYMTYIIKEREGQVHL
jgi:hypothetical protein